MGIVGRGGFNNRQLVKMTIRKRPKKKVVEEVHVHFFCFPVFRFYIFLVLNFIVLGGGVV